MRKIVYLFSVSTLLCLSIGCGSSADETYIPATLEEPMAADSDSALEAPPPITPK